MLVAHTALRVLLSLLLLSFALAGYANSTDDEKANAFFESVYDQWLARSPLLQSELGIKTDYGKWDNLTDKYAQETQRQYQAQQLALKKIDPSKLSKQVQLSYQLLEQRLNEEIEFFKWRFHDYPVNQMFGWHTIIPSTLINTHIIANEADAQAYIERLNGVKTLMAQVIEGLNLRAQKGIIAPKFVFPMAIDDSRNLLKGAPFDKGEASVLAADFSKKVAALKLSDKRQEVLLKQANRALLTSVKPAYENLIHTLEKLSQKADDRAGAWKFPDGEAFYNAALQRTTTTDLTAEQIHNLGLSEVARIHAEMRDIMQKVDYQGNLHDFFTFVRTDKQFYYADTEAGRKAYLDRTNAVVAKTSQKLDALFITKPKAQLLVKPVEAFREKSAGKAFYQSPPPDGSRPGIYYVNLYNMAEMPTYQLEALVHHEALPGHHLQLSIATELGAIPRFRKFGNYTAYIEGWGLYAELLPKEIGMYSDPYADFGRLDMELWRACRLVVDTGIHAKKWTRQQAIDYLLANTPSPERASRKAIERYIVMPSQATAYKVGMLKILELREKLKQIQGPKFDIRQFHEKVLGLGAVPLNVLEKQVLKIN